MYCFKNFYTLNLLYILKLILKLLQHVSVPLDIRETKFLPRNQPAVPNLAAQDTHRQGNTDLT